jgi:hypothetical protein
MWSHQVTGLWVIFVSFSPHITIGSWGNSLPVCAKWSELLLFSSVSRCIALWLFPQQSGAIQFWVLTSVPQDKLWELPPACFGKLDCRPTLTLTFVAFPHSFSESSALRVQLLAPPQFSGQISPFYPHLHCPCYITVCCLCFSGFFEGGFSLPRGCTGLCSQGVARGVAHVAWCSLFILQIHASSFRTSKWVIWHCLSQHCMA